MIILSIELQIDWHRSYLKSNEFFKDLKFIKCNQIYFCFINLLYEYNSYNIPKSKFENKSISCTSGSSIAQNSKA